jgi:hypothetical protein
MSARTPIFTWKTASFCLTISTIGIASKSDEKEIWTDQQHSPSQQQQQQQQRYEVMNLHGRWQLPASQHPSSLIKNPSSLGYLILPSSMALSLSLKQAKGKLQVTRILEEKKALKG